MKSLRKRYKEKSCHMKCQVACVVMSAQAYHVGRPDLHFEGVFLALCRPCDLSMLLYLAKLDDLSEVGHHRGHVVLQTLPIRLQKSVFGQRNTHFIRHLKKKDGRKSV